MFNAKQLFTKKYLIILDITLFFIDFNRYGIVRFRSLKVSKSYQNNQVTSIKKLLGVPNSFSLYCEIA